MPKKLDGLKIAKEIAKNRNGRCLSNFYKNSKQKLLWQCKNRHTWYANLNNTKDKKHWCPKCALLAKSKKRRLHDGLDIAKRIASTKNGKCLSSKYINSFTHLVWKCEKGHKWKAKLNNIKFRNSWCPECGRIQAAKSQNNSFTLYHWKTNEGLVCQASWEKKVVEYFNKNKINFRWQPRSFLMPDGKKYYPDLYLFSTKKWVEIKGYMREHNKVKWDWFHKERPNSELWDSIKLKQMKIL
jgi:ribosomal protein S27AE